MGFRKSSADGFAGAVAAAAAFAVYWWTAAPSVTLLDSGEFLLAAQQFGVPHPTGYPLWTLLAWLWQLLPMGNPAWEIALFSGVLGALAVGIFAGLCNNMLRWALPSLPGRGAFVIAVGWGLLWALSEPMWSQAVIAEVYTLHALLIALFFLALYGFIRNPSGTYRILLCFFLLALAFSNHHLSLALAPLPFLATLLVRRRMFLDLLLAAMLTGVLFYLLFAMLSADRATLKTSVRLTWIVLMIFVAYTGWRKFRVRWKLVAFLPFAVALGLLPYVYLPLASATNPPMNWGYAKEREGFYFSINRSQYGGSLHEQFLRSAGRLVGTDAFLEREKQKPPPVYEASRFERAQLWTAFFWTRLAQSFTPLCFPVFFCALLLIRRGTLAQRTWLYCLFTGFFLSAFLQPLVDGAATDRAGWWLQMPYHTYSFMVFAWICALGAGLLTGKVAGRFPHAVLPASSVWIALLAWPWHFNYSSASQRERWFGWFFGHEMLAELPHGAVIFGGTDPGRFVPTWMIFGESAVDARHKRDPGFDRRDLYLITQNGLVDSRYLRYIRDQYTTERPAPRDGFERWLGRDSAYPERPIELPGLDLVAAIATKKPETDVEDDGEETRAHSEIARWIFENNKENHEFFVEESFPMEWSYDYAVPHGLVYRLEKEPVEKLAREDVERDFAYWSALLARFLADPLFVTDLDARRSFSKLRTTTGNLYRHREMLAEAEAAYLEALSIDPANLDALVPLANLMWDDGRFAEVPPLWENALREDPNNRAAVFLYVIAERRAQTQIEIQEIRGRIQADPSDPAPRRTLVEMLLHLVEEDDALAALEEGLAALPGDIGFLKFAASIFSGTGKTERAIDTARKLTVLTPEDPDAWILLSAIALDAGEDREFLEAAKRALEVGGLGARRKLLDEPAFHRAEEVPGFDALLTPVPK